MLLFICSGKVTIFLLQYYTYSIITVAFLFHALKATTQKFRNLQGLQTPVKIVFHPSIVISIFILALGFIHETRVVRILKRQSYFFH